MQFSFSKDKINSLLVTVNGAALLAICFRNLYFLHCVFVRSFHRKFKGFVAHILGAYKSYPFVWFALRFLCNVYFNLHSCSFDVQYSKKQIKHKQFFKGIVHLKSLL
jgi:hypothetical protein